MRIFTASVNYAVAPSGRRFCAGTGSTSQRGRTACQLSTVIRSIGSSTSRNATAVPKGNDVVAQTRRKICSHFASLLTHTGADPRLSQGPEFVKVLLSHRRRRPDADHQDSLKSGYKLTWKPHADSQEWKAAFEGSRLSLERSFWSCYPHLGP